MMITDPAFTSTEYAIRQSLAGLIAALNLTGIGSNVLVRMLPKVGESLDTVPCVIVAPVEDDQSQPLDMEGNSERTYPIQIVLVDAVNGDFSTNDQRYSTWKELVTAQIEKDNQGEWRTELPDVPSVYWIEIQKAPNYDPGKLAENYAYFGVVALIKTTE